jgi:GTP pyrophosphokinase
MDSFSKNVEKVIKKLLKDWWITNYEVDYRIKSIFSIYKKMQKKWLDSIKNLYDLFWIRVIVKNETDCYKALWMVHKNWTPIPNRFKDYIALPKPNWYKSLHTTIIWLLNDFRKQPTEIQIKTYEMKEFSDIWVAAHFEYKEKWSKVAKDIDWVKDLKDLTESLENNDFVNSLKIDVFSDRIFVFTPKWDLINLPSGSTPIDFAYYVHSDLWDHISIAKVNWEVRTLDKALHNWDVIDVIIDKNKKPNPFWLSFVKTAKAKNRIKNFIKQEDKDLYRERWREILSKYLEKTWLFTLDKDFSVLKVLDSREYKIEERWQILEQIWNFSITPASIFKKILKTKKINLEEEKPKENTGIKKETTKINKKIIIGWDDDIDYKLASCCKRKIPKKIVAHINSKWIVNIHRRDCSVIKDVNKDRLISAYIEWNETDSLEVSVIFTVLNKKWILKIISDIIYVMDINIEEINFKKISNQKWDISLNLKIPDYDYLIIDRLIERVKLYLKNSLVDYIIKHIE